MKFYNLLGRFFIFVFMLILLPTTLWYVLTPDYKELEKEGNESANMAVSILGLVSFALTIVWIVYIVKFFLELIPQ